jgi:hypothetical protein
MLSHTTTLSGSAVLLALLSGTSVTAQLLGCDAVGCPIDGNRFVHCEVGNSTLKSIGITNVTTLLDSRPLTWTLGLQEIQGDGSNLTLDRNFYLGTPPSLQLNDTDGCALFFDGISANLSSTAGDDKFTCSNVLAESCVSSLITQAQSTYEGFGSETDGSSGLCNRLRDSLVNKPPTECSNIMGTWGTILAQRKSSGPNLASTTLTPSSSDRYLGDSTNQARPMPPNHWSRLQPVARCEYPQRSCRSGTERAASDHRCRYTRNDSRHQGKRHGRSVVLPQTGGTEGEPDN